jgi:hypothetical protein
LNATQWELLPQVITGNGTIQAVMEAMTNTQRFFRIRVE